MIIVHNKDYYVRPHSHIKNSESLFVIKGVADLVIFNKTGKVVKKINLGDLNSEKIFYYRIPKNIIHTLIIKSKLFIFHEVTEGPFNTKNTFYPYWSKEKKHIVYEDFKKNIYNAKKK